MNYIRILSKSSVRSSTSGKSLAHSSEEVSKLRSEIDSLKQSLDSLKGSVESRDAAIGTLAREKENLYVELKTVQRTNRNLHQQLTDERDMHSKEKEYLVNEVKRFTLNNRHESIIRQKDKGLVDETQFDWLREDIKRKDEVIFNICSKYLKVKSSKIILQNKLEKLQCRSQKICEDVISLLQENRNTLNGLLEDLLRNSSETSSSNKYFKLLKTNADLHYENTQLKICLSSLNNISNEQLKQEKMSPNENKREVKRSKSERKIMNKMYSRQWHSIRTQNHFKNIDTSFLSHLPTEKYRINSDPCLNKSIL